GWELTTADRGGTIVGDWPKAQSPGHGAADSTNLSEDCSTLRMPFAMSEKCIIFRTWQPQHTIVTFDPGSSPGSPPARTRSGRLAISPILAAAPPSTRPCSASPLQAIYAASTAV